MTDAREEKMVQDSVERFEVRGRYNAGLLWEFDQIEDVQQFLREGHRWLGGVVPDDNVLITVKITTTEEIVDPFDAPMR